MPVECYKQTSAIKEGVIMRLQCITYDEIKCEKNTDLILVNK